ncbi:unnamed protein product [Aphanomyces euteiches]
MADSKNTSYLAITVNEPAKSNEQKATHAEDKPRSIWVKMLMRLAYVIAIPFVMINDIFWLFTVIIGTISLFREWLGWKHEMAWLRLVFMCKYHEAEFYRANAKRFDALVTPSTEGVIKTVEELVEAQAETVSQFVEGGESFINTKGGMALSSVVVSAMFYAAYLVYFWHQEFDIGQVNSKVHDALAIILPWLLQEELEVALSQVMLSGKWITANFDLDSMTMSWILTWMSWQEDQIAQVKAVLSKYKLEFDNRVNQLCLSVGIGAIDMKGASTFITSLWTLILFIQSYIADSIAGVDNSNNLFVSIDNEIRTMEWLYWFFVYYSGALVLFCFLPFFTMNRKEQKKAYESVAASCKMYLMIKNLSNLQDSTTAVLTNEAANLQNQPTALVNNEGVNDDRDHDQSPFRENVAVAYPIIRRLRQQASHQLETNDIISYTLYVLALYTYDFFRGEVDGVAIRELKNQNQGGKRVIPVESNQPEEKREDPIESNEPEPKKSPLKPINQVMSYFWNSTIGEVVDEGKVDDAIPSFLLRVPSDNIEDYVAPPMNMTLFSVPVMGIRTFEDVLTERKITNMASIYRNQLVQAKKIYLCQAEAHTSLLCIGLEVKIMENYIVSIYIVAEEGAKFGHGPVYVSATSLQSELQLFTRPNDGSIGFSEVFEDDQLRAFASCTLDIDPTLMTKPLSVVAT